MTARAAGILEPLEAAGTVIRVTAAEEAVGARLQGLVAVPRKVSVSTVPTAAIGNLGIHPIAPHHHGDHVLHVLDRPILHKATNTETIDRAQKGLGSTSGTVQPCPFLRLCVITAQKRNLILWKT